MKMKANNMRTCKLVQGMLGKEFSCSANPHFSTTLVSLTNISSNMGCFHPEAFQACLLSALFVFDPVFY